MGQPHNKKVHLGARIQKRGRPRAFDCSEALDAAQRTFERNGYAEATLDELTGAMGINRPSLYAAFNDKKSLYQRSLNLYAQRMRAKFTAALDEDDLKKGLHALYKVALDAYRAKDGEVVGCMVACTAVTTALHDDDIRRQTKNIMDDIDALIARRIVRAVREGDLPMGTKVSTYSQLVVGVLHTLALRARAGASRRALDELAEIAVATLTARRLGRQRR